LLPGKQATETVFLGTLLETGISHVGGDGLKLQVLYSILSILHNEGVKVDDIDAWGETLEAREICLECGQRSPACVCRSLHPYTCEASR
jgi:hypothetical protein